MNLATESGLLAKLPGRRQVMRCSFYADDVALFMTPSASDASMIKLLLNFFGNATSLHTNVQKISALPIICGNMDHNGLLQPLGIPVKQFPCTYLGMPLSLRALRKVDLEPWLLKFGDKTAS